MRAKRGRAVLQEREKAGAATAVGALEEAFEKYLRMDVASGDATDDTIKGYRREAQAWLTWCKNSDVEPGAATRDDVEKYRESLKDAGLAVSTRRHKLSIIRAFYLAAVKESLIVSNPAEGVKGGKDLSAASEKMHFLAERGLVKLLGEIPANNVAGARDRAIIALMAIHGLRRIEVHRLDHENLRVEGDNALLEVLGKGNKARRVYLRPDTHSCLQNYLAAKFNAGHAASGAMFVALGNNGRGQRLGRQSINEIVDKYLNRAALKRVGVSCHALRHTFGTLAVAGGAKVEHVRDAMGHSRLETTSIYVKAVERAKNNPANHIGIEV